MNPNTRKKNYEMALRTTGSQEKAAQAVKALEEMIERVNQRIANRKLDPIYHELGVRIDARVKDSKYLPFILEKVLTLEQAKIVRALPDPHRQAPVGKASLSPEGMGVSEQFSKELGMDKATVDRHLVDLYCKGVVFPTRRGWQFPRTIIQFKDSATNNPEVHDPLGRDYYELWAVFFEEEYNYFRGKLLKDAADSGRPTWRIIPRWKAIKDLPGVQPFEDVREILKKAQAYISITNCPCRKGFAARTCDVPVESCVNFGRTAEYNVIRGSGRKVTLKEALDAFNALDKYALVHLVPDQKEVEAGLLCNCHWDCCASFQGMYSSPEYKMSDLFVKSRFEAVTSPEKCIGCGVCVQACNFEATGMQFDPKYGAERSRVDTAQCKGCGCCVIQCPVGALSMRMWQPDPNWVPDAATKAEE